MSRNQNVDIEVRWFDPYTHDLATTGRSGNVAHVLDGRPVPYVARPYKTILLDPMYANYSSSLVILSQMFDLNLSAMKATLGMLIESSEVVKDVTIHGTRIDWVLEVDGRTVRSTDGQQLSSAIESLILLELAGVHARHHARVEPTVLLLDELLGLLHPRIQIAAIQRLQTTAESAQVAVITHSPQLISELSSEWSITELVHQPRVVHAGDCPIDFEIETTRDLS